MRGFKESPNIDKSSKIKRQISYSYYEQTAKSVDKRDLEAKSRFKTPAYYKKEQ